jgi:hypothetical protein
VSALLFISKRLASCSNTVHEIIKLYETVQFGIVVCIVCALWCSLKRRPAVVPWLIELPSVERSILKETEQS